MSEDTNYAIVVENLIKKYDDLVAVAGISFKIKQGEVFAFLGPNGAGKTTTVEIIEGVRKPTSGNIRLLGYDVAKKRQLDEVKLRIGTLPQDFSTHSELTVFENVRYWSRLYDKHLEPEDLIKLVKLEDKWKAKYKNLSGGLKRRLGIAIALVNDPEVVFLDEPTTGLDPRARRDTWEIIEGLKKQGKTIFLTTHYMMEAEVLADTVAIIHKGKIMAIGSPEELIDAYGGENKIIIRSLSKEGSDKIHKMLFKFGPSENEQGDIIVSTNQADIAEVVDLLEEENISYRDIITQRPTLEDVFLVLTGEALQTPNNKI